MDPVHRAATRAGRGNQRVVAGPGNQRLGAGPGREPRALRPAPPGRATRARPRAGVTLAETLVALSLTILLMGLLVPLLGRWRLAGARLARQVEALETERVVRDLVGLASSSGGLRSAPDPDDGALAVRNYVATAVPCGDGVWRYRGVRAPDPERDSIAWTDGWGRTGVSALLGSGRSSCTGGAAGGGTGDGRWVEVEGFADPPVSTSGEVDRGSSPVLLRVFEAGSYRLSDALRYGRTGTRPQPLTAVTLDPDSSAVSHGGGAVEIRFTSLDGVSRQRVWRVEEGGW